MGQWVVTVAGIAILSVLCDVILPEGQTRKYIKTIVGIVVTIVMLQPILNLIDGSRDFGLQPSSGYSVSVQQSYLDMVEDKERLAEEKNVKSVLNANGFNVTDVDISKSRKTVIVQVDSKQNNEIEQKINSILKNNFSGYIITVKWK